MGDVEILINKEETLNVVQHHNLRALLTRLEGLERHRVLRWLTCSTRPPDVKVPSTTECPRSPDELFNRSLWAFFVIILGLGVIKILFEQSVIQTLPINYNVFLIYSPTLSYSDGYTPDKMWLIYPFEWSRFILLVMLIAVPVAAAIVKKKTKRRDSPPPRKEEVKTISGLIQEV